MAAHTLQDATLGSLEGEGFAFVKRTMGGDTIQGVFFGSEEDQDELKALRAKDKVRFKGVVYNRRKSGGITEKKQAFLVNVRELLTVYAGERAFFEVLEQA
ncbi:MAG: hypothetical protein ACE5G0_19250 [Rhodothermales bacterium]